MSFPYTEEMMESVKKLKPPEQPVWQQSRDV